MNLSVREEQSKVPEILGIKRFNYKQLTKSKRSVVYKVQDSIDNPETEIHTKFK